MSSLFNKTTGFGLGTQSTNSSNNSSFNTKLSKTNLNQSIFSTNNTQSNKSNRPLNNYLKTIDNCLEEATRTGDLLLSNKSLIEFPSTIALKYDLTDTLTVDLVKNRLSELPKELLRFKPLEKLILNTNLIRSIPDINLNQLKCIKILDLNSNRLTYLPASICNLISLEILTVNNNKLVSLPEEIGRLEKLIQLDVSCNEITHLPIQMGDMTALRSLNVRRNLLVELPKELSQLKLVSFDCTSNRISKLPLSYREMVTLIDLLVDNNPLEVPPAHVCTKGLLHIMKYLLVEAIKEEKKRGILSEYEINSQFSTTTNNQRSSCNSSNCVGSIGSFLFQNSVRNMSKKYSDSSSTTSSTESTTSSVSSASQLSLKHKQSNLQTSNLVSQSINSLSSHSSNSSNSKQNLFLNENIDFIDPSPLTSSPSSSSSSSPPIQQLNKSVKSGSIHELLSLKSPSPAVTTNVTTLQQQQLNYLKYNRNSSALPTEQNDKQDDVWRLTEPQRKLDDCSKSKRLYEQQQFDANFSIVAGLSSCSSIISPATNNCSKQLLIENKLNNRRLTNEYNYEHNSQKTIQNSLMPSHSMTSIGKSAPTISIPVIHSQQEPEQLIYDESLNPISQQNTHSFKQENKQEEHFYQSQQIWIPRNDLNESYFATVQSQQKELNTDSKSLNPAFTIRRHFIQIEQEQKQIETLRKAIESKLKIQLPPTATVEELGASLSDGVVLCHLMNQVYPRAIQMIHVPSLAMPKLSLAKCRKNVENFIDSCRRIGLDENDMCCAHDIIEGKNVLKIARTVIVLASLNQDVTGQQPIYEYRPQTIGSVMSNNGSASLQVQPHQQQTAV